MDTRQDNAEDAAVRHGPRRRRKHAPDLRGLDPRSRIRTLYQLLMSRDRDHSDTATARDRLP